MSSITSASAPQIFMAAPPLYATQPSKVERLSKASIKPPQQAAPLQKSRFKRILEITGFVLLNAAAFLAIAAAVSAIAVLSLAFPEVMGPILYHFQQIILQIHRLFS